MEKNSWHHPFMLGEYPFKRSKGGVPYHQKFSTLGFDQTDAQDFSFVELLNIPTIGNTEDKLFFELLDKEHLQWLESLILDGDKQFVIISQRLVRYVREIHKKFNVLGGLVHILKGAKVPAVVLETQSVVLYYGYSLSAAKPNTYYQELASTIRNFLEN